MTTQIFTTEGGGILWRVAFSPDSKNLVYSGGNEMREIVIAENFR